MLAIIKAIFKILDEESKKKFFLLTVLLFISGILSLIGVGAVIPFITVLLTPEKNFLHDYFADKNQINILVISICIMIFAFWIKNIVSYYCVKKQSTILYGIAYKFSRKLFRNYMSASYAWHITQSTPELVRNVINECSVVASGILSPLGSFSTELITSIFVFMFLLYINVKFTLMVTIALLICMLVYSYLTRHKARFYAQERADSWVSMGKDVMQGIGGIKETRIYDLENFIISSFERNTYRASAAVIFSGVYTQASRFVLEAVGITIVMLSVCFIWLKNQNNSEILLLLSIFGVAGMQLLPSLNRLMTSYAAIKYSAEALNIVEKALLKPIQIKEITSSRELPKNIDFQNELTLENVFFAYPDGTPALNNVSITIKKGQTVAFVGHSGAGKTTLADIILGLFEFDAGKMFVDGLEVNNHNQKFWRKLLGYIPQNIYLYDCTIRENVAFGIPVNQINDDKVWEALEIASVKEFVQSLSEGLSTQIGENGIRLSGGQRQRIGIARALFRNPKVLIMDEATSALDTQTEREVTQAIQQAAKDRTVITIAHRLSTVKNSDVIFVLENGNIIAKGSYEDLVGECKVFNNLIQA